MCESERWCGFADDLPPSGFDPRQSHQYSMVCYDFRVFRRKTKSNYSLKTVPNRANLGHDVMWSYGHRQTPHFFMAYLWPTFGPSLNGSGIWTADFDHWALAQATCFILQGRCGGLIRDGLQIQCGAGVEPTLTTSCPQIWCRHEPSALNNMHASDIYNLLMLISMGCGCVVYRALQIKRRARASSRRSRFRRW